MFGPCSFVYTKQYFIFSKEKKERVFFVHFDLLKYLFYLMNH